MSYEEIAERFGISLLSARRMVHRRKWQKTKGNDGRAVVQVPNEFIDSHHGKHRGGPDDEHDGDHSGRHDDKATPRASAPDQSALVADVMARLVAAQENVADMARKLGVAEGEIAALKAQADEARETIAGLAEKANRAATLETMLETERKHVEEWKAATVDPLKGTIEALKGTLEAERRRAADLRENRDSWYAMATERRGWWPWRRRA
jgi:hypothetical protein